MSLPFLCFLKKFLLHKFSLKKAQAIKLPELVKILKTTSILVSPPSESKICPLMLDALSYAGREELQQFLLPIIFYVFPFVFLA